MKILTVVPTYNEIENIEAFIGAVFQYLPASGGILVVDDSSPDRTAAAVEKLVPQYPDRLFLLKRAGKLGGASAFLEGFAWGIAHGYDALLAMDADFSHDPKYIPLMAEKIETCDLVIGSRNVPGGGVENRSWVRNIITRGGALYSRITLGCPIRDFTGGYNLWRKETLEKIGLANVALRGYSFQLEMKYKACKAGCNIVEVPIIFPDRKHGTSKMSNKYFFDALMSVWKIRRMA
ncbi:hypothetical protein AGMMS50268_17370 [Spirochaetia bacterium]|nr:hypothetical protein AGMMS50268_17370 [Spirochaetia bacterium]